MRVAFTALACGLALAECGSSGGPSTNASSQYSRGMRSHGVSNFPDPGAGGELQIGPGVNPRSPAFQSAQQACKQYLPNGGQPPTMSASELRKAFAFAECMRSHGEPDFPDPTKGATPSGGEPVIALRGMFFKLTAGLDPMSPAFRQAASVCGVGLPTGPSPRTPS